MSRLFDSNRSQQSIQDRLQCDAVRFLDGHVESTLAETTASEDRTGAPVFAPQRSRQRLLFEIEQALTTGD